MPTPQLEQDTTPAILPLFPLTGTILLPRARIPLVIFEPRYLVMTRDAMAHDRLIGMIQPSNGTTRGTPPLFRIGCAGKITSFEETEDGRFLITLTGISRFRVVSEIKEATPYRQAKVAWAEFTPDRDTVTLLTPDLRKALQDSLQHYLERLELQADWDAVGASEDESLVNSLSMVCPFSHADKQALLECATVPDRARALMALMAFAAADPEAGNGRPVRH